MKKDTNSSPKPPDIDPALAGMIAAMPQAAVVVEEDGTVLAASQAATASLLPEGTAPGRNLSDLVGLQRFALRRKLTRVARSTLPATLNLPVGNQMVPFRVWSFPYRDRRLLTLQQDPEADSLGDRLALWNEARRLKTSLQHSERQRERLEAEAARLEFAATHDPKTGLLNSVAFERCVNAALSGPQPGGLLLYLDLNGFKAVNDSHGHAVGDHVLNIVARRLEGCMRGTDILARLGGDEFAIWVDPGGAMFEGRLMDRLAAAIEAPLSLPRPRIGDVTVSAAIGVARAPQDGTDADTLARVADARMYADKAGGRLSASRRRSA